MSIAGLLIDTGLVLGSCAYALWTLVRVRDDLNREADERLVGVDEGVAQNWRRSRDFSLALIGIQTLGFAALVVGLDWWAGGGMTVWVIGVSMFLVFGVWFRLALMHGHLKHRSAKLQKSRAT